MDNKELDEQLQRTEEEVQKEINGSIEPTEKKRTVGSIVLTIIFILISIFLLCICVSSVVGFFSQDGDNTLTIPDAKDLYDGEYLREDDYTITSLENETYNLNNSIPVYVSKWRITNNGKTTGYPAAYLVATQKKGDYEIELEQAENLLMIYDNSDIDWSERFNKRYSNIEAGESNEFYTAFILYDTKEEVETMWKDIS